MPSRRLTALTQDGGEQPLLQYSPMCSVWALTSYDACDIRCSYCASYAQGPSEPIVPAASVRDVLEDCGLLPPFEQATWRSVARASVA